MTYRRGRGRQVELAVLLTSHNRCESTLQCLESLFTQDGDVPMAVILVDDASSDGTPDAVKRHFPDVHVVPGSGSYFWAGGMRVATQVALTRFDSDFHLWLNDDVILAPDALKRLLSTFQARHDVNQGRSLVVGALKDPATHTTSYSGLVRAGTFHRLRFKRVDPSEISQLCDTMNGNVVLLPKLATTVVGYIDRAFTHSIADTDYGLRATKLGWEIVLAPGYVGSCPRNPPTGTFMEADLPIGARWRQAGSPKGLPFQEWATYTRRHGGLLWPAYLILPYIGIILSSLPFFRRRYLKRRGLLPP